VGVGLQNKKGQTQSQPFLERGSPPPCPSHTPGSEVAPRMRLSQEQVLHNKPCSSESIIDEGARPQVGPAKCKCGGGLRTCRRW
jgi:hypothetical protein